MFDWIEWPSAEWRTNRLIEESESGSVYEIQRGMEKALMKVIYIPRNPSEIEMRQREGMSTEEISHLYKKQVEIVQQKLERLKLLKGCEHLLIYDEYKVLKDAEGVGWKILLRSPYLNSAKSWFEEHFYVEERFLHFCEDVLTAVEICHVSGILHENIAPESVFINENGDYILGDFGIDPYQEQSIPIECRPPEADPETAYSESEELYALGILFYKLLNRMRGPFMSIYGLAMPEDTQRAIASLRQGTRIPDPLNGSREIRDAVLRSLSFMPTDRFANCQEFRKALGLRETEVISRIPVPSAPVFTEIMNRPADDESPDTGTEFIHEEEEIDEDSYKDEESGNLNASEQMQEENKEDSYIDEKAGILRASVQIEEENKEDSYKDEESGNLRVSDQIEQENEEDAYKVEESSSFRVAYQVEAENKESSCKDEESDIPDAADLLKTAAEKDKTKERNEELFADLSEALTKTRDVLWELIKLNLQTLYERIEKSPKLKKWISNCKEFFEKSPKFKKWVSDCKGLLEKMPSILGACFKQIRLLIAEGIAKIKKEPIIFLFIAVLWITGKMIVHIFSNESSIESVTIESERSIATESSESSKSSKSKGVPEIEDVTNVEIGGYVSFGKYEQDNIAENGKEAIEWMVLYKSTDSILLMSRDILEYRPYDEGDTVHDADWKESTLRQWLNTEFLNEAFDISDESLLTTTVNNDKVFLLSASGSTERNTSFVDERGSSIDGLSIYFTVTPTTYAESHLADTANSIDTSWWLKTAGKKDGCAAFVTRDRIDLSGKDVGTESVGVRPVVRIDMKMLKERKADIKKKETLLKLLDKSSEKQYVNIGTYEQDGLEREGPEDIQWVVLRKSSDEIVLVSRFILDCQPYNSSDQEVTWEESTLREWLLTDFMENAFNGGEKMVLKTEGTEDPITILTDTEFKSLNSRYVNGWTPVIENKRHFEPASWWLRTEGSSVQRAPVVINEKLIERGKYVTLKNVGVRPVLRIQLQTGDDH